MSISREEVFSDIASAALFGSLGLFVGTGFSKALTNGEAPSFNELLQEINRELSIGYDFNDINNIIGKSFPSISQEMAVILSESDFSGTDIPLKLSINKIKRTACKICSIAPNKESAEVFRNVIGEIPIQWVITTNYDFILEDIIPNSIFLLPDRCFNARTDYVPIYHLHGHIREPKSLILTDSDYISLFSPTEYRQLKLNLLLAESTTLMLGYSFGDVNVQSAMQWSKTFIEEKGLKFEKYQSNVIQALYKIGDCSEEPYSGHNGEIIIETSDILDLLEEISDAVKSRKDEHESSKKLLKHWLDEEKSAAVIADDHDARAEFIETIKKFPRSYDVQILMKFLNAVLDPIWQLAREDGGFDHYDRFLSILLDILENIPVANTHPSLLNYLGDRLDDVSGFFRADGRRELGTSWAASKTWRSRNKNFPKAMRRELLRFAKRNYRYRLENILEK